MRVVGLRLAGRGEVDSQGVLRRRRGELGSRGKPFAPTVRRLALGFPKEQLLTREQTGKS